MSSVTLASRMRRVMLVLAAAAVLVMMMAFSAAPAMAGAAIPEPAQPVVTEPVLDNILGLTGLANDLGIVSIDNDLGHGDLGHAKSNNGSGFINWDRI